MKINREIKQVIVMRTDLNMRKGKMIAQGAHASIMFVRSRALIGRTLGDTLIHLSNLEQCWMDEGMTKICVRVDSEQELVDIHGKAEEAGLMVNLVVDAGLTEFSGIPTKTCLAVGPNFASDIDLITGGLKLL